MRSGGVFLNNRYHDPTLGRFVSVDPLISVTGDAYGYAGNNPITYSDPTGLCATVINGRCRFGGGQTVNLDGCGSSETVQDDNGSDGRVSYDGGMRITNAHHGITNSAQTDITDSWRNARGKPGLDWPIGDGHLGKGLHSWHQAV